MVTTEIPTMQHPFNYELLFNHLNYKDKVHPTTYLVQCQGKLGANPWTLREQGRGTAWTGRHSIAGQ